MKTIILTAVLTLAAATGVFSAVEKAQYKTVRFNVFEVGVSCLNGGDPAVKANISGVLIVSCGNNVNR